MVNRQQAAHFLLGFFAMPVCILLGGMEALFFHWHGAKAIACMAVFVIIPLAGSLWSRQRVLAAGLITGLIVTACLYAGCSRMSTSSHSYHTVRFPRSSLRFSHSPLSLEGEVV